MISQGSARLLFEERETDFPGSLKEKSFTTWPTILLPGHKPKKKKPVIQKHTWGLPSWSMGRIQVGAPGPGKFHTPRGNQACAA